MEELRYFALQNPVTEKEDVNKASTKPLFEQQPTQ
jgi:hypothetical protein